MIQKEKIAQCFINGEFERIECPQCENTFLTRVYDVDCIEKNSGSPTEISCKRCRKEFLLHKENTENTTGYVILEKYALALQYYLDAIKKNGIQHAPKTELIALISEDDEVLDETQLKLFSSEEPDYRLIYLMEKLQHLTEEEEAFFDEHVYDLEDKDNESREKIIQWIAQNYDESLANDIKKLCLYYRENQEFIQWDLHGHNLMRQPVTGKLVILDPFAPNFS
jgi:ribosomal protein S27E